MTRVRTWPAAALAAALVAATGQASEPAMAESAYAFLTGAFGMDSSEIRDVQRRRAVGRSLPTEDNREVATLGIVHVRVPPKFYLDQLRDVVSFKRGEAVQQIGTFGTPARVEDLAGLTIPEDQLEKLRRCRPHDCNLQLSSEAMARFSTGVNWTAPDWQEQANAVLRQVLVDLVNDYRHRGAAALMEYTDRRRPVAAAAAFDSMLADPPAVLQRFPALHRHVVQFPRRAEPEVGDVIYWSREKLGPAHVISVTHMAYTRLDSPAGAYAAASRQIYGSQYFDASLGLTLLLPDSGAGAYLVYVNRSRLDVLGGVFGALKRAIVRARTRAAVADHLIRVREMVEKRLAAAALTSAAAGSAAGQRP